MLAPHPPAYRPFGAFRFGLAMMVLLQHGLLLLPALGRQLFFDLEIGTVAVTTFLALSGFIVAEATSSFYAGRPIAFIVNRALRLLPPFLASLVLTICLDFWLSTNGKLAFLDAPLNGSPIDPRLILATILEVVPGLPAHAISQQDFSFIPFAWTLRIEFSFYIATFLAMLCIQYLPVSITEWKSWVHTAILSAGYVAFGIFAWRHLTSSSAYGARQLLCIPFFGLGISMHQQLLHPGRLPSLHLFVAGAATIVAFSFWGQRGHPLPAIQLPLLVALLLLLWLLSRARSMPKDLAKWDRRLGALSYPLYISHGIVLTAIASLSGERGLMPYVVAIGGAVGLAMLLYVGIEHPISQLRDRLRGTPL